MSIRKEKYFNRKIAKKALFGKGSRTRHVRSTKEDRQSRELQKENSKNVIGPQIG